MDNKYLINIEKSILSTILFNYDSVDSIIESLDAEDFFLPAHQSIFVSMQELHFDGYPIDEDFIYKKIKQKNIPENILLDIMVTTEISNVTAYIQEIKDHASRRRITSLANKIRADIQDINKPTDEILSILDSKTNEIRNTCLKLIDETPLTECSESEAEFYCKNWLPIPKGTISLISAPGGTGKTYVILQVALRFLLENPDKKVFLWLSEDRTGLIRYRANQICNNILNVNLDQLPNLIITSTPPIQMLTKIKGNPAIDNKFHRVKAQLNKYDLIVFDPLLAFYGGDENDNSQARVFMQPFMNWASEENKAIVFLHHSAKSSILNDTANKTRGAGAFVDACRVCYEVNKIYKKDNKTLDENQLHMRNIKLSKDNYGAIRYLKDFNISRQITPYNSARETEMVKIIDFVGEV